MSARRARAPGRRTSWAQVVLVDDHDPRYSAAHPEHDDREQVAQAADGAQPELPGPTRRGLPEISPPRWWRTGALACHWRRVKRAFHLLDGDRPTPYGRAGSALDSGPPLACALGAGADNEVGARRGEPKDVDSREGRHPSRGQELTGPAHIAAGPGQIKDLLSCHLSVALFTGLYGEPTGMVCPHGRTESRRMGQTVEALMLSLPS